MKQQKDLQMILVIDMINDMVVDAMVVYFMSELLVGILCNYCSVDIKEYNNVIDSLMDLGSYIKNPCKLDLYLKSWKSSPTKPSIKDPPNLSLSHYHRGHEYLATQEVTKKEYTKLVVQFFH